VECGFRDTGIVSIGRALVYVWGIPG
jgi:hypothetical protein